MKDKPYDFTGMEVELLEHEGRRCVVVPQDQFDSLLDRYEDLWAAVKLDESRHEQAGETPIPWEQYLKELHQVDSVHESDDNAEFDHVSGTISVGGSR